MKVVVAHKNGPRTHHPPADPSQSCWYMDTHGNNGLIIGTKGATIKSMQKQSGAMHRRELYGPQGVHHRSP
jgi:hypothetical protein